MITRLLAALGLLVVGILGLGSHLDWFPLSTEGADHNPDATIAADRDTIQQDTEKVQGGGQPVEEKTTVPTDKAEGDGPRP